MTENILVIHQGSLGDVILSFPALKSLRRERNASLAVLCKNEVGKVAHKLDVVDAYFPVESARFSRLFSKAPGKEMKAFINHYDIIVVVSFSDGIKDNVSKNHKGHTCRINPRPPAEEETHIAADIVEQMKAQGLLRNSVDVADALRSIEVETIDKITPARDSDLFLIHPGAGSRRKRWPLDRFIEVAAAVDSREVAFLIGPAEMDLAPVVKKRAKREFKVHEIHDLFSVIDLMKASRCFIGNDSGLAHLAGYMGIPLVAIFGPASPIRWHPLGSRTKVVRGDVHCAPCFETAETNCKNPQCLNAVSVDMVLEAVQSLGVTL